MSADNPPSRVIFLDIDGVLQPDSSQKRFKQDLEALREDLVERFHDPMYRGMDKYDVGAVAYDWNQEAVDRLRRLCEERGARCVISSNWRCRKSLAELKALFRIRGLHDLIVDKTGAERGPPHYRAAEVRAYLEEHAAVERFVILDDSYIQEFEQLFPNQFVRTFSSLDELEARRADQILAGVRVTQPNRDAQTRALEMRRAWQQAQGGR